MDYFDGYSDELTKVEFEAIFAKGKFFYNDNLKPISLQENSIVKVTAYLTDISEKDLDRFKLERKVVLKNNTYLKFDLPKTGLTFHVLLHEDLLFRKIHNKPAIAEPCKCEITHASLSNARVIGDTPYFKPIEVESLNQAFFQISIMFREQSRSHTTNIYNSFRYREFGVEYPLAELRF